MAIYVGEKNALLLKNDRSVVEFYKGNTKIFGYNNSKQGRVITADDVHPIEHKLKIKISSDSITDFSGVNVTRCGKNLFDKDKASDHINWVGVGSGYSLFKVYIGKGNTVTVSHPQDLTVGITGCPYFMVSTNSTTPDGAKWIYHKTNSSLINKAVTLKNIPTNYIYLRANVYDIPSLERFMNFFGNNNLQIEINTTATDYEEYKPSQTVSANADGTVEGITGLPNMTILSDADGVVINCEYVACS